MGDIYRVLVKPGSKKGPLIEQGEDGQIVVYVRERAIDGSANQAVAKLLAGYLEVPKSSVSIKRGLASKHKIIQVG
jgi:uncharacterized protein